MTTNRTNSGVSPTPGAPPRIASIDVIRAVAVISIVLVHTSLRIFQRSPLDSASWWAGNFYFSLRSGALLFFMVSGIILLKPGREEPVGQFLKRRFVRVVGPALFWVGVYYGYNIWRAGYSTYWLDILKTVLRGPVHTHLWFLYALVPIYLAIPVLRLVMRDERRAVVEYLLVLGVLGYSVSHLSARFFPDAMPKMLITMFAREAVFCVAGSYLFWMRPLRRKGWLLLVWILAYASTVAAGFWANIACRRPEDFFANSSSPSVIVMTFAAFSLITQVDYARVYTAFPLIERAVGTLARSSFSVYMLHMILLAEIPRVSQRFLGLRIDYQMVHPLFGIPLFSALIIGSAMLVVQCGRHVPVVRYFFRYS